MKLYKAKIPEIAKAVIERLCNNGDIEVAQANRPEAEQDLVSIMEEYLRRDHALRNEVKESMAEGGIGYEKFGRVRSRMAEEWNHPLGEEVEKYLARQFIENFMISRFIDEVYEEDGALWRKTVDILRSFNVDEQALRDEARSNIKNIREGTVEFEIALQRSLRDVKKRRGLL
ncbi:MAG: DUF507 family protein [Alphaproteobacteria bacterium]|nr:DUF507 family protein [Alphaproteobacteria bacterium]